MPRQKKQKLIGLGLPANLLKEFIQLSYKGNTSTAPEGYEIDTALSDSRVKVYTKPNSKEVIIVHRGSVGAQDWIDNAKFFVAGKVKGTKSFNLHKERQLKAVEKYGGENIIGLGHSRAGLYLQELQKDPSTKLNEIITYNKAVGFYDALRTNPDEQTDVKVKNDFVSLLSGLQKRKNKMVEIEATKNPLDFNKAHQAEEIEKLGETFIGKKDELSEAEKVVGSGTAPKTKTEVELKALLSKLEKQKDKIKKGKVYKTTNIDKVNYAISYIEARLLNYATKGVDLIITKKKKYGDELPKKAKPYKEKPKKEKPKKEEPKKEENKLDFLKLGTNYTKMDFMKAVNNYIRTNDLQSKTNEREFRIDKNLSKLFNIEENKLITYFQSSTLFKPTIIELFGEEPKKEEPKKEEPKKEEPKKEEPKKKEKSQKQKDFAERQKNSAILFKIIKTGNKNIVKRLYDELITEKQDWHKEIIDKYMDGKGEERDPNTSKSVNNSVYDILYKVMLEFIEKYSKYMVEFIENYNKSMEAPKKDEPGSSKDHAKIELPEPEPTKQKIEPLLSKLQKKVEEFEKVGREHGAVIYASGAFNQVVAYIALLLEYEAKCAIVGSKAEEQLLNIDFRMKSNMNKVFFEKAKSLSNDLLDCIERGDKLIAIPLTLHFGSKTSAHANLLIYRPYNNTIERFEPHGDKTYLSVSAEKVKIHNEGWDKVLTKMFEVDMKPYLKQFTPKFISPDQVCPTSRGFQSLESAIDRNLKQEGAGFCGMWMLFVLELLFINPTIPTAEIIQEALAVAKNNPQYLKNVIRGYVLKTEKMLDNYVKKIDANDGFTFTKEGNRKLLSNKGKFQEKLLELLLSFGGKNSQIQGLEEETALYQKNKSLMDLLRTKTREEINEAVATTFNRPFSKVGEPVAKGWTLEGMITHILDKYGAQFPGIKAEKRLREYFDGLQKTGGIFGFSAEEKEARKKEKAEKRDKINAEKKARSEKMKEFKEALSLIKKKKQAKKEATEAPKAEAEPEAEPEAEAEPVEGGIFGWSTKEKADKAERKMLREEYYKTHNRQQNANYTFDKTARNNWKREFYKKNTFKKADDTMPKAVTTIEQQGIDEAEQEMLGSGMYYLKEIIKPTNPIFKYKRTFEIPTFIDPETEFLMGGAFTDMLGMNCNKEDGSCFNPVWERRKIRSQILSEYKIWYNPFAPPAPGTIRMAWLNPMIEERFKPIYDEFVARRNVNVGLPADASRDRFAQQMFSNITDGLSYIPGSNIATAGLTLASTLSDSKKEDGT